MLLLLDSQAVLWLLNDSPRLGASARQAIATATRVHVSAATIWELTIRSMLGKLSMPAGLLMHLTDQGLTLLSVSAEHAEGIRMFPELARHDPFDRLLAAQASQTRMHLLTADRVLLGVGTATVAGNDPSERLRVIDARR